MDASGTWITTKLNGGIAMTITPASQYAVTTIDGDPYSTKNTWQSGVSIEGDQVVIDANGFDRKETYRLYTDADGNLMLDGGYTFKGEPWGKVRLQKVIEQASGARMESTWHVF